MRLVLLLWVTLGVGCASTVTKPATLPLVVDELSFEELTSEEISLRYIRPYFDGQPTLDIEIIEFLRNQLSDEGTLVYRDCDNHVVIHDRAENIQVARYLVAMLDYSGLPLPYGIAHVPLKIDEESIDIVPAIPE